MTYTSTDHTVTVPLTTKQIAIGLKQLPQEEWKELEMLLDEEFMQEVHKRGKTVRDEHVAGKTISLDDLKNEFHV